MKTKLVTLVSTVVLAACDPGMVGSATLCDEAVGHLSACGITAQGPAQCDMTQEKIATEILGRDCTGLTDRSTFSGSSCGFLSWLFGNCKDDGGENEGEEEGGKKNTGWTSELPKKPEKSNCFCDDQCESFDDCCNTCLGLHKKCNKTTLLCDYGKRRYVCSKGRCLGHWHAECDSNDDCVSNRCGSSSHGEYGLCQHP